jgi:hypothetical protein
MARAGGAPSGAARHAVDHVSPVKVIYVRPARKAQDGDVQFLEKVEHAGLKFAGPRERSSTV